MTDIIERLEYVANFNEECGSAETIDTCHEAIAEIKRLREEVDELEVYSIAKEFEIDRLRAALEKTEINTDQSSVKWWVDSKGGRLG